MATAPTIAQTPMAAISAAKTASAVGASPAASGSSGDGFNSGDAMLMMATMSGPSARGGSNGAMRKSVAQIPGAKEQIMGSNIIKRLGLQPSTQESVAKESAEFSEAWSESDSKESAQK